MYLEKLERYLYMINNVINRVNYKMKLIYTKKGRPMYFVRPIFVYFE
ncbi:uncharacterized protein METZ01_LOCUS348955 [marine metagenome]|uniref:Uncharacterized protein n=1 Tax=marine metagenome TaxID=408172 RepID=A0A382RHL2_9ZZZZ